MNERREAPRVPFAGKVYLTYNGRCRCEEVLDVSPDGLQIRSGARLKPGKPVKIFLPLPSEPGTDEGWRLCLLKGEVARRTRIGRGDSRLGITLTDDAVDTRVLLADFVARA